MDPTIPLGIGTAVAAVLYAAYLAKGITQEFYEEPRQPMPMLLPEQAVSLRQTQHPVVQAIKQVREEKKEKALAPLEKVHPIVAEPEEEEEWILIPEEEEPEEEIGEPPLVLSQSRASDTPIDQLEEKSKKAYYNAICDIADKVVLHYEKHGKITRDGMVPSTMTRKEWDHTMAQPHGIFWKSLMLETQNGVTVIVQDCDNWLHLWLRERGYRFDDGIYSEEND